ncbi:DNA-binding response regulator [Hyphomicrobium methylovorum]|nr:DNA-binding response regulator [Hyphomicrobium methylovorum]
MRILLVEDDDGLAARLSAGLRDAGFVVEHAKDGEDGWALGVDGAFDAAVLDLGLPTLAGLDVLRRWRSGGCDLPVLILTAHGTWTEKVEGLNSGADDYLSKPFHTPEVVARLRALIRRKSGSGNPVLQNRDITLDTVAGKATADGRVIELTALEMRMLSYFMHRVGRVISQQELVDRLYSLDQSTESNTIEVYISRLRRKLGRDVITTVRGLGYRMD